MEVKASEFVEKRTASMRRRSLTMVLDLLHSRSEPFELELGDWSFRLLWFSVVTFHAVHALAYLYQCLEFMKTVTFEVWTVYLRRRFGHTEPFRGEVRGFVAIMSGVLTLLHFISTTRVLWTSVSCRRLEFQPPVTTHKHIQVAPSANDNAKPKTPRLQSLRNMSNAARRSRPVSFLVQMTLLWSAFTAPSSPYFEMLFNARKVVEIAAQIAQVYHVFTRISALWATNTAVLVVILNCWIPPLIRFVWRSNVRASRVLSLVSDIWLTSFFTILVPFITYLLYLERLALLDDIRCWGDPAWISETGNLLKLLLVNSWPPALASAFTAITMLLGLEIVKSIVKRRPPKRTASNSGGRQQSSSQNMPVVPTANVESAKRAFRKQRSRGSISRVSLRDISGSLRSLTSSEISRLMGSPLRMLAAVFRRKIMDLLFVLMGAFVIATHMRSMAVPQTIWAARRSSLTTCLLQRMPWFVDGYSCAVLKIQCDSNSMGSVAQITDALVDVLPDSVHALIISDCPDLKMPAAIQQLHQLVYLELLNSTLHEWSHEASLTAALHPSLAHILLLNMTNVSSLPEAITSAPISTLIIHSSDLVVMPTEVQWHNPMDVLMIERSQLTDIPPLLFSTRAHLLSLASNRILQVPAAFLYPEGGEQQQWSMLALNDNPITSWPADNGRSFLATRLYFQDMTIRELPSGWTPDYSQPLIHWVYFLFQGPSAWLSGSPMCDSMSNASQALTPEQQSLVRCASSVIAQTPFDWLLQSPRPPISFATLGGPTPFHKT